MDKGIKIVMVVVAGVLLIIAACTWAWLSINTGKLLAIPDQLISIGENIFYMIFGGVTGGFIGNKMKKS